MHNIELLIRRSEVHQDWHAILVDALGRVNPEYLADLVADSDWLPGTDKLFNAFRQNPLDVRYLLIGESPYPRAESANGIAFYDAAVDLLWSNRGLSKAINRATSMRNIIKAALVAENRLIADDQGKLSQQAITKIEKHDLVQTMPALFENLQRAGFLMLNATPVLHPVRKPAQEAIFWQDFLARLLTLIAEYSTQRITLLLWGKIAQEITNRIDCGAYDQIACEHPYNISFIDNKDIQQLFSKLRILERPI